MKGYLTHTEKKEAKTEIRRGLLTIKQESKALCILNNPSPVHPEMRRCLKLWAIFNDYRDRESKRRIDRACNEDIEEVYNFIKVDFKNLLLAQRNLKR